MMNSPKTIIPALITLMLFAILFTTKQSFYKHYDSLPPIEIIENSAKEQIAGLPDMDLRLEFFSALDEIHASFVYFANDEATEWHVQNTILKLADFKGEEVSNIKVKNGRTYVFITERIASGRRVFMIDLDDMLHSSSGVIQYDEELNQLTRKEDGDYGNRNIAIAILYILSSICLIWFLIQFATVLAKKYNFFLAASIVSFILLVVRLTLGSGTFNLFSILINEDWAFTLEFGLNAVCLGGLAYFVSQNLKCFKEVRASQLSKIIFSLFGYMLCIWIIVWNTLAIRHFQDFINLFGEADLLASLWHMLRLNLGLTFVGVVCIAQFVFLYAITMFNFSLSKALKLILFVIAIIAIAAITVVTEISVSDYVLGLSGISLWLLMDLFVDRHKLSLLWTLVWLLCFSLIYSIFGCIMRPLGYSLQTTFFLLFSQLFLIGLVITLAILLFDCFVRVIPEPFYRITSAFSTFYRRIELLIYSALFGSLLISFVLSIILFVPINKRNQKSHLDQITQGYSLNKIPTENVDAHLFGLDLALFNEGRLRNSDFDDHFFPLSTFQFEEASMQGLNILMKSFQGQSKLERAYLKLGNSSSIALVAQAWNRFLRFHTYALVLCLIVFGISQLVWRRLYQPLYQLKTDVKNMTKDSAKQISWEGEDEIGLLIRRYNDLITDIRTDADKTIRNEKEYAWREMAKQVAHEIKNPLTPMKLSLQYLEGRIERVNNEMEAKEIVRSASRTLIEQIENLTNIANSFSNFARMPQPEFEETNLNDLLANVHNLFSSAEQTEFNLYVPIDDMKVMADRNHLLQVLNNLMKNAIQAIPDGRHGRIDIRLYQQGMDAIIEIADNGIGIPPEIQKNVFSPNFTTKNSGTGLGLAISYKIIAAHHGSIYFKTREQMGTSFYVQLPLYQS